MKGAAKKLHRAMILSAQVGEFIESGWNILYNDMIEHGPIAAFDEIATQAMLDAEEHNIRVFSL